MPKPTEPTLHPSAHHLSLGDLVKYGAVIAEVIQIVQGSKAMSVGAVQHLPDVKFQAAGEQFSLSGDASGLTLSRTS